jgi:hypothetical protein
MTYYGQASEEFPDVGIPPPAGAHFERRGAMSSNSFDNNFWDTFEYELFDPNSTASDIPTPQASPPAFPSPPSPPPEVQRWAVHLGVSGRQHAKSALSVGGRKKNQIKKGEGKDAKKDERDGYDYVNGHFYGVLTRMNDGQLGAKTLFKVVLFAYRDSKQPLLPLNRWCKRRMPNAYSWLDDNKSRIDNDLLQRCLAQAKEAVEGGGLRSF